MKSELRQRKSAAGAANQQDKDVEEHSDDHHQDDDGEEDDVRDSLSLPSFQDFPFMPSRLRQLLSDPALEIASRVCRDVVIRLPIRGAAIEEVMSLVSNFGPAEYISRGSMSAGAIQRERMARSFGVDTGAAAGAERESTAASSASSLQSDEYCHYVSFKEGVDALRCVLQLNGTMLDPKKQKKAMEEIGQIVEERYQALKQAQDENSMAPEKKTTEEGGNEEEALWRDLSDAMKKSRDTKEFMQCADEGALVVVVTCDFFRSAFLEESGDARVSLIVSQSAKTGDGRFRWFKDRIRKIKARGSSSISSNPVQRQQAQLAAGAKSLERCYHVVAAEGLCPWEDLTFAANYFSFLYHHNSIVNKETGTIAYPWEVVHKALGFVGNDVPLLLSWLDVANSEDDLWSGNRESMPTAKGKQQRGSKRRGERDVGALRENALTSLLHATSPAVLVVVGAMFIIIMILTILVLSK